MATAKAMLIGINGYGKHHLNHLLKEEEKGKLKLVAVSDLNVSDEQKAFFREKEVSVYGDYKEMLRQEKADFVIVSTPIQLHAQMSIDVMEAGFHLMTEKPPAAVVQDVDRMIATAEKTGKRCEIGFHVPTRAIEAQIAGWIQDGTLGEIKTVKGMAVWKRLDSYYERTPWAGKLSINGQYVLDGTINNPQSHVLYNVIRLAKLAKNAEGEPIVPKEVTAELYHAHEIEGEDLSCLRIRTNGSTELYFYATVCGVTQEEPYIRIEGTRAAATWMYNGDLILEKDGEKTTIPGSNESVPAHYDGLLRAIEEGEDAQLCPLTSTRIFTQVVNAAFESSGKPRAVDPAYVRRTPENGTIATVIDRLEEHMDQAFASNRLYSELGLPWGKSGKPVSLEGYDRFQAW